MAADPRINLKNLAANQLPEFVRAEYPTFVAFVEAYYEYMDKQNIDMEDIRDIDSTLDEYIKYFKAELAHNYPVVSTNVDTERFLLKHIKEQYLAKGSEASYKLLFRLLYGKDVLIDYPGRQMLRISDGRWTQDVSIFVQTAQGDAYDLIGKTIAVQTGKKIYNTAVVTGVEATTAITLNVQNVIVVDAEAGIYELFVDRNFYGEILPYNTIKYGSLYQGTILPCTAKIKIVDPGKNFRPGMVFQLSTGEGTPFWFKVSTVNDTGGLKTIDTIRFGLFYNTNFAVTVLPGSAVSSRQKKLRSIADLSYKATSNEKIVNFEIVNSGYGYVNEPTVEIIGDGTGATAHAVVYNNQIIDVIVDSFGDNYTYAFVNIIQDPSDTITTPAAVKPIIGTDYEYSIKDSSEGFTEAGYINYGDYWDHGFSDGAYVGTIVRQFFINAADTQGTDPASLSVQLEAIAKYPGYYKTNDGFLNDSMMIQDSYYFQAFAYVLKIDEQLQSYASVVRSMLHPSGMAMFGEYSINNSIALNVGLTSLVKSLGVTVYDEFSVDDEWLLDAEGGVYSGLYYSFIKDLSTTYSNFTETFRHSFVKSAEDSTTNEEEFYKTFTKAIGATGQAETIFAIESATKYFTKSLEDYPSLVENYLKILYSKSINDFQPIADVTSFVFTLNTINDPLPGYYPEAGYVVLNPYDEGSYQAEWYTNNRDSTFST